MNAVIFLSVKDYHWRVFYQGKPVCEETDEITARQIYRNYFTSLFGSFGNHEPAVWDEEKTAW